jgi:hypothetical protein
METKPSGSHGPDRPLPQSLANRLGGWSRVAQQYPVFSQTWYACRLRSFIVPMGALALILIVVIVLIQLRLGVPGAARASLALWSLVALALTLGRGLAVLVCKRRWPASREVAGVVCALVIGILPPLALAPFASVASPSFKARKLTEKEAEEFRVSRQINLVVWTLALAWLGGAGDLARYVRQRRMLRETELLGQVARYKDERNEVEMRLSLLASQVEPHFLFNTLSGVRAAMSSDPARGIAMIDHLVDYLRATIPQLRSDRALTFVSLGSQLDAAQAYLGIVEARLPRLRSRIDCPAALRELPIPPLMLISLVENAVKHGMELKQGPGLVHITAAIRPAGQGRLLELTVMDDGVGFGTTTSGSGIGLSNIRERLQHLYGGAASLSLRVGDAGGVAASIVFPIQPAPGEA